MLKIYDSGKKALGCITKYKDLEIESELSTGDKTLSFTYLARKPKDIQNEYYIETQNDRYVVKETGLSTDGFPQFQCQLDLEDLERDVFEVFSASERSLTDAAELALEGTGWTVDTDIVKKRSVATMKATPLTVLGKIRDAWMCEMQFDTKKKTVRFREQIGKDKGVFFTTDLNLQKLELTVDTYDYYTRLIPIGKDDLRIDEINEKRAYVENYQYTSKIRTMIWEDSSYTDAEALKEDAEKKLEDLSKPKKSYSADILNLAAVKPQYSILSFQLGDTITLMDERTGVKDKQRIVKLTEYPQKPEKNKCELSNTTLTFEEYQAKLEAAANAVENITNADGTVNGVVVKGVEADGIVGIETVIAGSDTVKKIGEDAEKASKDAADAVKQVGQSISNITMHYLVTAEKEGITTDTPGWTTEPQDITSENRYLWTYQTVTSVSGKATDSPPVISAVYGENGQNGEDGILLYIDSSNGTVFKNDKVSTTLSVVIYHGANRITDIQKLRQEFGATAYLQWKWKLSEDEEYVNVALDDYRLSDDGFKFSISPDDIVAKAIFICDLIV